MILKNLSNGIPVRFVPIKGVEKVGICLGIASGSADDPEGKDGIAHLTEHMIFSTNGIFTTESLARDLEWHGIKANACTSYGSVKIILHAPKEHFAFSVQKIFDMISHHDYDRKEFIKEKGVVVEELRMYKADLPDYVCNYGLMPRMMKDSSLARNIIGTEETLAATMLADVIACKLRAYHSGNFCIAVAGAVSEKQMLAVLEKTFGKLPKRQRTRPFGKAPTKSLYANPMEYEIKRDCEQAHVLRGYFMPKTADKEYPVALLTHYIIGGGMSSRAFQELRERRGLGYSVGMYYAADYGYAYLYVHGFLIEKTKLATDGFDKVITDLDIIKDDEFNGIKELLASDIQDWRIDEERVAMDTVDVDLYGSLFTYDDLLPAIKKVTKQDVLDFVPSLIFGKYTQVIMIPQKKTKKN